MVAISDKLILAKWYNSNCYVLGILDNVHAKTLKGIVLNPDRATERGEYGSRWSYGLGSFKKVETGKIIINSNEHIKIIKERNYIILRTNDIDTNIAHMSRYIYGYYAPSEINKIEIDFKNNIINIIE